MRTDISFNSEGLTCQGWLYGPDDLAHDERRPAIVMAHGFSAVKEMYLDNFATQFADAGLVVMVFDYRFFGDSEGEPRGRLFPFEQIEDYRNAISWVSTRPEVDSERIGLWGNCYSGGHVLYLAAFDCRVKALVSQFPFVNGWSYCQPLVRPGLFSAFLQMLGQDCQARYNGEQGQSIPVVAPEGEISALPTPDAFQWFTEAGARLAPNWRNAVSLASMEKLIEYKPAYSIHRISPTPLLMIAGKHDILTSPDLAQSAYERALPPKSLVITHGGHFDAYTEPGLSETAKPATQWFKRYLLDQD